MRVIGATILQVVILVVVASGLGIVANQLREHPFDASRNWFPKGPAALEGQVEASPSDSIDRNGTTTPGASPAEEATPGENDHVNSNVDNVDDVEQSTQAANAPSAKHIEHEFQSVTTREAAAIVGSPDWEGEMTIFVDARSDREYNAGHIPGAFHLYYYQVDDNWPAVEMNVLNAQRVVVYCNGGECEDSILLARDLAFQRGVDPSVLGIYEGGWAEWSAGRHPIVTGSDRYESADE